jgi:ribosomal protein S18 acetylase RimI-like enzyme
MKEWLKMTSKQIEIFVTSLEKAFAQQEEEGVRELNLILASKTESERKFYESIYALGFQKAKIAASHLMDVRVPNDK